MNKSSVPKSVDEYIAGAPPESRPALAQLRRLVRSEAPRADEVISYGMPYYKYNGPLVGFAAYKAHISLFGALPEELGDELKAYETGKGTVRFPIDRPLPVGLIRKLLRARVAKNDVLRR